MLTKQQLLKSSNDQYMKRDQLDYFMDLLNTMHHDLMANIKLIRVQMTDNAVQSDPLDAASQEEIKQITLRRIERDTQMLHRIEHSLDLIRHHEYGYCEQTGDEIGIPRLLANPTATVCIDVAQLSERRIQIEGDLIDDSEEDAAA